MRALQFIGRWAWVGVMAVTLVIGMQFLQAVSGHERTALLGGDVQELRGFQERMLQVGVGEWLLGTTAGETTSEIADEADAYVAALIAEHDFRAADGADRGEFRAAMIASLTAASEELRTLSLLNLSDVPELGEPDQLGRLFGEGAGSGFPGSVFEELASNDGELRVLYGALGYTAASARITQHLDAAAVLAAKESGAHFSELRRTGELGLGFLLVGGILSATGYAWAGHRASRMKWEVERASERAVLGSEFVSLASHELRTPLVGIFGFSELLLEDEDLPPHARDWVGRIHKESGRLTRIVEDLLDVSRIESGRMEVSREAVDFAEVLDSVYGTFEGSSPLHHLRIRGDLDLQVVGDHDKLIEVLSNLVDNAIKYSVDGGLVVIDGRIVDERLEVRVIDEGVGIPTEALATIFERFGRARQRSTEHVRSTGLGLYLVQEVLRLMESTISVESKEGVGSTFMFSLPVATEKFDEVSDDAVAA